MKKLAKALIIIFSSILFLWFFLPLCLFGVFNAGNMAGMFIFGVFLLYGIFFGRANLYIVRFFKKKAGKTILSLLLIFCIVALTVSVYGIIKLIKASDNPPKSETTVIVLGCMVYPHGPSLTMQTRLDAAYKYLTENPDINCVLSGGKGDNEPISEAQAMKDYLTEKGIDQNRLYMEDRSTSTIENLRFSKDLIEKEGLCPTVTIITNGFHQYRANKIAAMLNMESYSVSGKTPFILAPTYYLRELGGILIEMLGIYKFS